MRAANSTLDSIDVDSDGDLGFGGLLTKGGGGRLRPVQEDELPFRRNRTDGEGVEDSGDEDGDDDGEDEEDDEGKGENADQDDDEEEDDADNATKQKSVVSRVVGNIVNDPKKKSSKREREEEEEDEDEDEDDGYDYVPQGLGKGTRKVPRKGAAAAKIRKDRAATAGARGKPTKK
jgi:hypothetical protein